MKKDLKYISVYKSSIEKLYNHLLTNHSLREGSRLALGLIEIWFKCSDKGKTNITLKSLSKSGQDAVKVIVKYQKINFIA